MTAHDQPTEAAAGMDPEVLGRHLRGAREAQGIGLRELARRLDVSASFISQVENGRATPSVGTLYSIVNQLNLSLDVLFNGSLAGAAGGVRPRTNAVSQDLAATPSGPVVRANAREIVHLATKVSWGRLTAAQDPEVDFLYAVYEVGGASCDEDSLMRHAGHEYGLVLEGRLGLTIGFESWELEAGDSVSFPSTTPHRLWTVGDRDAKVVWFVRGRNEDQRKEV